MPSRTPLSQVVILGSSFWRVAIGVITVTVILIEPGVWLYEWLTNSTPLMCQMQNVPRGSFRYGSSATWLQIFQQVDRNIKSECPEFQLHFVHPPAGESGSDMGIKMLLNNQIDFAVSSRRIKKEEYQEARMKGFEIENIPVALDGIAIAVHPNLPISGLSITQLKQILVGKITNWKQVGGTDLKITLYARKHSNTFNFIEEDVLEGQPIRQDIEIVSTATEGVRKVASDAGGIYLASASYLGSQCTIKTLPVSNQLNKLLQPYQELSTFAAQCSDRDRGKSNVPTFSAGNYRLTRPLFIIVKQNGGSGQQAGKAYADILLTPPRQELIEKAGFLRIR
ncbi:MAG: PstS family phosphate ABC transporter substrate-binding protein [Rhizonema sp. PD38]|nr:PstS family phosphate ABC transporter substrate-binding protein [Rhizonema sp. PD38]